MTNQDPPERGSAAISAQPKAHFLAERFASPGLLSGSPLLPETFPVDLIEPENLVEFFKAHVLGPAWQTPGTKVTLISRDGRRSPREGYYHAKTRLVDAMDRCPFTVLRLWPDCGLADPGPESCVAGASHVLTDTGIPHVLERSILPGEWVAWIFFEEPVRREEALVFTHDLETRLNEHGLHDPAQVVFPLLQGNPEPLFIPYHYSGAGWFGVLHRFESERLVPVFPSRIATHSIRGARQMERDFAGGSPSVHPPQSGMADGDQGHPARLADQVASPAEGHIPGPRPESPRAMSRLEDSGDLQDLTIAWEPFVFLWGKCFGKRGVRAGELVRMMDLAGVTVPELIPGDPGRRQAILLGKAILENLCGRNVNGYQVHAAKSGNSHLFRLVPAEECDS